MFPLFLTIPHPLQARRTTQTFAPVYAGQDGTDWPPTRPGAQPAALRSRRTADDLHHVGRDGVLRAKQSGGGHSRGGEAHAETNGSRHGDANIVLGKRRIHQYVCPVLTCTDVASPSPSADRWGCGCSASLRELRLLELHAHQRLHNRVHGLLSDGDGRADVHGDGDVQGAVDATALWPPNAGAVRLHDGSRDMRRGDVRRVRHDRHYDLSQRRDAVRDRTDRAPPADGRERGPRSRSRRRWLRPRSRSHRRWLRPRSRSRRRWLGPNTGRLDSDSDSDSGRLDSDSGRLDSDSSCVDSDSCCHDSDIGCRDLDHGHDAAGERDIHLDGP
ncbi:hypothetical protein GGR56DRAFT_535968 [Xylariaceae sp. FL0804]|nr:hypothetical protein GGR56DRAFT_535968 [Xylariaceae sp. FL0804]